MTTNDEPTLVGDADEQIVTTAGDRIDPEQMTDDDGDPMTDDDGEPLHEG